MVLSSLPTDDHLLFLYPLMIQVESRQATDLLYKWEAISLEDVLELLGGELKYVAVRQFAASILQKVTPHLSLSISRSGIRR